MDARRLRARRAAASEPPAPADGAARRLRIRRNGSTVVTEVVRRATSPDVRIASNISEIVRLEAGDYLEVVVSHGNSRPQVVVALGVVSPEFQLAFLSPA